MQILYVLHYVVAALVASFSAIPIILLGIGVSMISGVFSLIVLTRAAVREPFSFGAAGA